MGVLNYQVSTTGLVPNVSGLGLNLSQQLPTITYLETNNTLAQVLVTGYLNKSKQDFQIPYSDQMVCLVYTTDAGSVWLQIAVTGTAPNYVYSLIGSSDVASVFIASLGSAAAPSYTFSGDLDTGIYSSAANTLDFSTGGTKRGEITSAGLAITGLISATTSITAGTSLTATAGAVTSGSVAGGFTVSLILFSNTAANGSLRLLTVGNVGNFATTISDVSTLGQASAYTLPDPSNALARILVGATATPFTAGHLISASGTGGLTVDSGVAVVNLLTSSLSSPDTAADLVTFNVACGQAALAAGGSVTLYASSGSKRYRLVSMYINSGGTNFSGGSGDRLGQVTDGTTVYSVVPATNMQTLINSGWGNSTPLPYPASVAADTQTAAGASLTFKYSGGTTDYTAGSIVVTGLLERIV